MEAQYINIDVVKEKCRLAQESAAQYRMVLIAERGGSEEGFTRPRSKILVKLAGMMISAGEKLKEYAEKDLKTGLRTTSMQDL